MALGSKLPLAARENEGYYSFPRKKKKHYPQRDLCRRTYLILHVKHFIHRLLYKVKGKWDSALEKLWFLGKTDLRKWSGPEDGHEWKYWANCSGRKKKKKASKSCNLIKNFNPSSEHSYLVLNLLEGSVQQVCSSLNGIVIQTVIPPCAILLGSFVSLEGGGGLWGPLKKEINPASHFKKHKNPNHQWDCREDKPIPF